MLRATKEGLYIALLVGMILSIPAGAIAQEPGKDVPAAEPPAKKTPSEEPPAKEAPPPSAPKEKQDEVITRDVDGQEWITPDVGAKEERDEENEAGDVDEVIIEYAPSPDMEQDAVKDAAGKEVETVPTTSIVSKSVEVQDPDKLEPGADKETGVQGQVVSRRPKKVLPDAPVLAKGEDDGKLRSTITDERGRYRLYLPPGKYT
ncbi:MAG: carboxypeptidase regulatory-like domain-containing protein, partial [Myxococcales bacterium]